MSKINLAWAMTDIAEDLILSAQEVPEPMKKRITRPVKLALIAAIVVVLLAGAAFAVYQYTQNANRMEQAWNDMRGDEMPQTQKDFVERRSADVGETVESQGISMTVDSVTVTEDMVYYTYTLDLGEVAEHFSGYMESEYTAMLPDGAECQGVVVDGRQLGTVENAQIMSETIEFDLPDDMTLSESKLRIAVAAVEVDDLVRIHGAWDFEIRLPACKDARNYDAAETMVFADGAELEISNIRISEAKISFDYTDNMPELLILAGDGFTIDEIKAADPDVKYVYLFYAKLFDGTIVPVTGGGSEQDENGVHHSDFYWISPIDLSELETIIFTNGDEENELILVK